MAGGAEDVRIVQRGGMWIPGNDSHFFTTADTYQRQVYDLALPYVRRKETALDIGAHIGIWSRRLAVDFSRVFAFEPEYRNQYCLIRNVRPNTFICGSALGRDISRGELSSPADYNTGAWELNAVVDSGIQGTKQPVSVVTLDSLGLAPDLVKIDTQGSELAILQGGERTFREHKPVLILEVEDGAEREPMQQLLTSWGGRSKGGINSDHIVVFE